METKKVPLLSDRVAALENVGQDLDRELGKLGSGLKGMVDVLSALMKVLGSETEAKVISEIDQIRERRAKETADRAEAEHQRYVEFGLLKPTDVISVEGCVVGGIELDNSGATVHHGTQRRRIEEFTEAARLFLVGKGVGAVFNSPTSNHQFKVTEVWRIDVDALKKDSASTNEQPPKS